MSEKPDLGLDLDDLPPEPMTQFRVWFEDAENEGIHLANAVALATASADGDPTVRHVLLRGFDERGFVVYTNRESRKGRDLAANPRGVVRGALARARPSGRRDRERHPDRPTRSQPRTSAPGRGRRAWARGPHAKARCSRAAPS